ncbi:hypothetical protein [Rhodanobacter terrae]|uniref:Phosphoglycerate kinase n=1 Tax=Rhodanobacter terrae TaxID=418647 RepID=A0ABW0SYR2_9GAMM
MNPQLILIAGPYRSGTDGDRAKIARNLRTLEQAALAVYRRGHVPVIGEWLALPLAREAGSSRLGDVVSESFLYPVARRLLRCCDAVLRIDGASKGADDDVHQAKELGLPVYHALADLPICSGLVESV